ncbi:hypothetical protein [Rubripirellula lacrimiformis]|uniref:hypothetical protein n=1 Tax=Rubripirellula lacrimiformis TaxID=1930273 RepID=UPI00119FA0A8|nr:hypothetical protein [Rubripirellula lacrimiformis]
MNTQKSDSVAESLSRSNGDSVAVIQWLEQRRELASMRRRATWCLLSGWLMLTAASLISTAIAFMMTESMRGIFDGQFASDAVSTATIRYAPWFLGLISAVLLIGGIIGWLSGRFPGMNSAASALDWSLASHAVSRLLALGCTYPDAFRTAAQSMRRCDSQRWLLNAAIRVESGKPPVLPGVYHRGDAAMLELMLESGETQPDHQWQLAAEHFVDVARRRLMLLTHCVPTFATLLAGLLIWISISATLGWMWKMVGKMVNDYGF